MITEEQLKKWWSAPSQTEMIKIKHTKDLIEKKLKEFLPIDEIKRVNNLGSFNYEVYLQWSYKNSTNIRFDSDVDIVIQLNSVFGYNINNLTNNEVELYKKSYASSNYNFKNFKNDIFKALQNAFGHFDVEYKNKCIKIKGNTNRVNADIVPAFQYRVYKKFYSISDYDYIEWIKLYNTETNEVIINFPKAHYENCKKKNKDTKGNFKSMVRIFKNLKKELVGNSIISKKTAPSYFIENLIYNCTTQCFYGIYQEQVLKILKFLLDAIKENRINNFYCANEQDNLFDNHTWNLKDATTFMSEVVKFYLNN